MSLNIATVDVYIVFYSWWVFSAGLATSDLPCTLELSIFDKLYNYWLYW